MSGLDFQGWAAQALEHASRALSILPLSLPSSTPLEERVTRLTCLLSIYQTQGGAALLLGEYPLEHLPANTGEQMLFCLKAL